MQIKKIILISFFSFTTIFGYSQSMNNEIEKKGTKFAGGSLSLLFGTSTLIEVSPHYGIYVTDKLSIAGGATFAYFKDGSSKPALEQSFYGGRVFARYDLFTTFFVHGEFEALNVKHYTNLSSNFITTTNDWLYSPLLGVGYRQMFGEVSNAYLILLWNFNEDINYPYSTTIFRFGFEIGF
jgi:hypothetical protein